jgi:DamX protein
MAEADPFTFHVKKQWLDHKSRVFHSLISQERTRKLELLIHLVANSRQALVVCGPEGIGKSTLLRVLQERKIESWLYCLMHGNADLSLEKIQEQISQVIQVQDISGVFRLLENQHKKMLLMIDEAGHLAPGLVNAIIDYAATHPVLRVVFVLTHDDLEGKNTSDSAIDDCHLIEIPPLSEKQCGEFLHYLATKPHSQVTFTEISDGMIETIYHKTEGIPGRIIAELPGFESAKQSDKSLWILIAAVAGLVALALVIQWFSASKYNIKPTSTPAPDAQSSSLPQPAPSLEQQNKHSKDKLYKP